MLPGEQVEASTARPAGREDARRRTILPTFQPIGAGETPAQNEDIDMASNNNNNSNNNGGGNNGGGQSRQSGQQGGQQAKQGQQGGQQGGRGFAGMDEEEQREIASKGGQAAQDKGTAHEFTAEEARKGGETVSQDREHMAEIGAKGGQASGGNRGQGGQGSQSSQGGQSREGSQGGRGGQSDR
jgi:uncharacterized protein